MRQKPRHIQNETNNDKEIYLQYKVYVFLIGLSRQIKPLRVWFAITKFKYLQAIFRVSYIVVLCSRPFSCTIIDGWALMQAFLKSSFVLVLVLSSIFMIQHETQVKLCSNLIIAIFGDWNLLIYNSISILEQHPVKENTILITWPNNICLS